MYDLSVSVCALILQCDSESEDDGRVSLNEYLIFQFTLASKCKNKNADL